MRITFILNDDEQLILDSKEADAAIERGWITKEEIEMLVQVGYNDLLIMLTAPPSLQMIYANLRLQFSLRQAASANKFLAEINKAENED